MVERCIDCPYCVFSSGLGITQPFYTCSHPNNEKTLKYSTVTLGVDPDCPELEERWIEL